MRIASFWSALEGLVITAALASAQCALTYEDATTDGTRIQAYSQIEDHYTDAYSGCAPGYWGSFVHDYRSEGTLTSPSGRSSMGSGSGGQSGGSGVGYSSVAADLEILGEDGEWMWEGAQHIDCSVAGSDFVKDIFRVPVYVGTSATQYKYDHEVSSPHRCYYLPYCSGTTPTCGDYMMSELTILECSLYYRAVWVYMRVGSPTAYPICGFVAGFDDVGYCN